MERKTCGICCEELLTTKNYCVTDCQHEFHTSCLYQCRKGQCPYCRQPIVAEDQLIGSSKGLNEEKSAQLVQEIVQGIADCINEYEDRRLEEYIKYRNEKDEKYLKATGKAELFSMKKKSR